MRRHRQLVSARRGVGGVLLLLALVACGSAGPGESSASAPPVGTSAPASPAGPTASSAAPGSGGSPASASFCAQLEANGASGASFGPINLSERRASLLADVQSELTAMGDATPPSEIAKPWALQKRTLVSEQAAAEKLGAGQTLGDAASLDQIRRWNGDDVTRAQDTLTAYWFAHCR